MIIRHPQISSRRLSFGSAGLRMSLAEFRAIEDFEDGYRFELIKGIVIVTPAPSNSEASSNDKLGYLLQRYAEDHPQGSNLDDTLPEREIITSIGLRRTDRSIWAGLGRTPRPGEDVPAIIVEIVSPGRAAFIRDFEEKRDEYLELGCKEYWVIDRSDRTLAVFRPDQPMLSVGEDQVYTTPLLPGFELRMKVIFAAADKYKK
jgi:Uma2 family endonuclease